MPFENLSKLDEAVAKYGGSDEVYKSKLKGTIRDYMGYKTYADRIASSGDKPLSVPLKGNITPGGVKALVGGAANMDEAQRSNDMAIAGQMDTAAEGLAADQISRSKKAADASLPFERKDWLDEFLYSYVTNPKNEDGSFKTPDQLRGDFTDLSSGVNGVKMQQFLAEKGITSEAFEARLKEKVPATFQDTYSEDQYRYMGYSKSQAKELSVLDKYKGGQMNEAEKAIYETINPGLAAKAKLMEENAQFKELHDDLKLETDQETGEVRPKYSLSELKDKYPDIPEADLKEAVKPQEMISLGDDVKKFGVKYSEEIAKYLTDNNEGYQGFMKSPLYKEWSLKFERESDGALTATEVDQAMYKILTDPDFQKEATTKSKEAYDQAHPVKKWIPFMGP